MPVVRQGLTVQCLLPRAPDGELTTINCSSSCGQEQLPGNQQHLNNQSHSHRLPLSKASGELAPQQQQQLSLAAAEANNQH